MEENKKYICKYCGKEFKSGQSLGAHIIHCKKNPNNSLEKHLLKKKDKLEKENPLQEYILKCKVCDKEYKLIMRKKSFESGKYKQTCSSECAHKLTTLNTNLSKKNEKISNTMNKMFDEGNLIVFGNKVKRVDYIERICDFCKKKYVAFRLDKSKFCSEECKKHSMHIKLSNIASKSNFGGYYPNSIKRYRHGKFKGIHCDSSWELAYLVYCLEHNIKIERCTEKRQYVLDNKTYNYFPDFVVNGEIIEIKGYYSESAKIKAQYNPDIKVLLYNDIKEMINYVQSKYGNKYWEVLYE